MDSEVAFQKSMKKLRNKDKFRRHVAKIRHRPKKIKRDSFIKNLERIIQSLQRRKITQNEAIVKLRTMLG